MSTENHRCMGTNCRMPDADNHSPECILETAESQGWSDAPEAIEARQAIAKKQEPFGFFQYDIRLDAWVQNRNSNNGVAFYTHPQPKREPLTDEELRIEFGKLYPNDIGILELAENNKDFALEAIGARHHWAAFKAGARAIEAAHGIKGES